MQGKDAEAELLYKRCQAIQKVLSPEDPALATTLDDHEGLLQSQVRLCVQTSFVFCSRWCHPTSKNMHGMQALVMGFPTQILHPVRGVSLPP